MPAVVERRQQRAEPISRIWANGEGGMPTTTPNVHRRRRSAGALPRRATDRVACPFGASAVDSSAVRRFSAVVALPFSRCGVSGIPSLPRPSIARPRASSKCLGDLLQHSADCGLTSRTLSMISSARSRQLVAQARRAALVTIQPSTPNITNVKAADRMITEEFAPAPSLPVARPTA